jgi:hypothetical protein
MGVRCPPWKRVQELIDDLVAFAGRVDMPTLRHRAVTRNVAIPVSAGLLADSAPSGSRYGGVTRGQYSRE